MDDLLRKLESAECGSRELDALIWAEQDGRDPQYDSNGPLGARRMLGRSKEPPHDICIISLYLSEFRAIASFPYYTTSLDAALTLVPDWELGKWQWKLFHPGYESGVLKGEHRAEIHSPLSSGGGPKWIAFANTPALALCIAALRARQAS